MALARRVSKQPDKRFLIGFHGISRSGKDTAAEMAGRAIHKTHGLTWCRKGFADQVKMDIAAMFDRTGGFEQRLDWVNQIKLEGEIVAIYAPPMEVPNRATVTGRDFIINYAEHMRRVHGNEFWTDVLLPEDKATWRDRFGSADVCLVSDVGFDHEIARIQKFGGIVIHIDREGYKPNLDQPREHSVVNTAKDCDFTIANDGDLAQLMENVHDVVVPFIASRV